VDDRKPEQGAASGASKGGRARAERLSPEARREIAIRAAGARWGNIQVATHIGEIRFGNLEIACAVLEDGTRVLSQSTVLTALGRNPEKSRRSKDESGDLRAPFLSANNLQPFISSDLQSLVEPIPYRPPGSSNRSWGYRAEMLPLVCDVYLEARAHKALTPNQMPVARAAEILIRGLARVGIVALVDEATGYQETRARHELQMILEAYVREELRQWVKTFPDDFFREIYRLQGWEYRPGTSKRTPQVGKLVNKYIYDQLPPGVHEELRRRNPKTEKGYRVHKHHQFLTDTTGISHLDKQIATVTTLMRVSDDRRQFEQLFEKAYPPAQGKLALVIDVESDDAPIEKPI
jgi:hypothetical protein